MVATIKRAMDYLETVLTIFFVTVATAQLVALVEGASQMWALIAGILLVVLLAIKFVLRLAESFNR